MSCQLLYGWSTRLVLQHNTAGSFSADCSSCMDGSGSVSSSGDVTVLLVLVHSCSSWYLLRVDSPFLSCLQPPFCHERYIDTESMYCTVARGLQVCFVLPLPPWAVLVLWMATGLAGTIVCWVSRQLAAQLVLHYSVV